MISFEWDENKNQINKMKHGVSFQEASTVFYDEEALLRSAPDHSDEEDRFVLLGLSSELKMLVVVHCYREDDSVIRIISARKASSIEVKTYNDRSGGI